MHRIDAAGHSNNSFIEGNPAQGIPATTVSAAFLNAMQEEMAYTIEQAGLVLDKEDNTQFKQAIDLIVESNVIPVGAESDWYVDTPPLGWLKQNGSLYSITVYNKLDAHFGGTTALDAGVACTFDDAAETVNVAGHGLADDTLVRFSNSGGALPPVITARYARFYIVNAAADSYQLSLTKGGAPIDIVGTGTGTHYFHTKFATPNPRGRTIRITDDGAGNDPDAATRTDRGDGVTGDNPGTKQADELRSHRHSYGIEAEGIAGGGDSPNGTTTPGYWTSYTGGAETRMINEGRHKIIKY